MDKNEQRTKEYFDNFSREKVIKLLIRDENPVVLDVGANSGASLKEFKSWWPGASVHCFEPQEECWKSLEALAETYLPDSVFINKTGVGATNTDELTFYTHEITTGQSGFNRINISSSDSIRLKEARGSSEALQEYEEKLNHARKVSLIRLDTYIQESEVSKINLLKIDTQGYEPEVLAGLGESLGSIDVVITELMFYDYYERSLSFSDIEKFLLPAGFSLYDISHVSKNPMNGRTDWVDVIYLNEKVLRDLKDA